MRGLKSLPMKDILLPWGSISLSFFLAPACKLASLSLATTISDNCRYKTIQHERGGRCQEVSGIHKAAAKPIRTSTPVAALADMILGKSRGTLKPELAVSKIFRIFYIQS